MNIRTAVIALVFALAPLALSQPAAAQGAAPVPTLAPIVKRVSPAVVNIATRGTIKQRGPQNPLLDDPFFRRFFDVPPGGGLRERQFQSAGSGVIVDAKNGYVLTNAHVIENASEITVTLQDGTDLKADVVGSDAPSDVAVLKVRHDGLVQLSFGDSSRLKVGDYVDPRHHAGWTPQPRIQHCADSRHECRDVHDHSLRHTCLLSPAPDEVVRSYIRLMVR